MVEPDRTPWYSDLSSFPLGPLPRLTPEVRVNPDLVAWDRLVAKLRELNGATEFVPGLDHPMWGVPVYKSSLIPSGQLLLISEDGSCTFLKFEDEKETPGE